MENIKNKVKEILQVFWRYKAQYACVAMVLFLVLSLWHYYQSAGAGSVNISFNYSEASQGLNPNGTRFNSYDITSNEVLTDAIGRTGLQDKITAKQLSSSVSVRPVDTGNAGGDDYISTTYRMNLYTDSLYMGGRSNMDLLKNICGAYKTYFLENYSDNQAILKKETLHTDEEEPFLHLNEIKLRVSEIETYMNGRTKENRTFTDEATGMSYSAISKRLKNIVTYDIPNATAYIIERGVAADEKMLREILEYKNKIEQLSTDRAMAYYEADNNGIAMYESLMSAAVMIPTLDTDEQYYMSRTKNAMDNMAKTADSSLEEAADHRKEIVSTSYVIQKMEENQTEEAELKTARKMLSDLEEALSDLSADLVSVDKAYIGYKAQNYITFNYYSPSLASRIRVKRTALETVLFLALLGAYGYIRTRRKKGARE